LRSIDAIRALRRNVGSLLDAKRAIEAAMGDGMVTIGLETLDEIDLLIGDLARSGFVAALVRETEPSV
jgi:hypothetical protein